MPDRAPYEILAYSPPTPQILPKNQIPINSHPPVDGFTIPDIRERILSDDLSILSFPWSVQIAFFAKINFDETVPDKLYATSYRFIGVYADLHLVLIPCPRRANACFSSPF